MVSYDNQRSVLAQVLKSNLLLLERQLLARRVSISDVEWQKRARLPEGYIQKMRKAETDNPAYSRLFRLAAAVGKDVQVLTSGYQPSLTVAVPSAYYAARWGLVNHILVDALEDLAIELSGIPRLRSRDEAAAVDLLPNEQYPPRTSRRRRPQAVALAPLLRKVVDYLVEEAKTNTANRLDASFQREQSEDLRTLYLRVPALRRSMLHRLAQSMITSLVIASENRPSSTSLDELFAQIIKITGHVQAELLPLHQRQLGGQSGQVIAATLSLIRGVTGISNLELEAQARLKPSYIQSLERGINKEPGYDAVVQLAAVCALTPEYLAGFTSQNDVLLSPSVFYNQRFGLINLHQIAAIEYIAAQVTGHAIRVGDVRTLLADRQGAGSTPSGLSQYLNAALIEAHSQATGEGRSSVEAALRDFVDLNTLYRQLSADSQQLLQEQAEIMILAGNPRLNPSSTR